MEGKETGARQKWRTKVHSSGKAAAATTTTKAITMNKLRMVRFGHMRHTKGGYLKNTKRNINFKQSSVKFYILFIYIKYKKRSIYYF